MGSCSTFLARALMKRRGGGELPSLSHCQMVVGGREDALSKREAAEDEHCRVEGGLTKKISRTFVTR